MKYYEGYTNEQRYVLWGVLVGLVAGQENLELSLLRSLKLESADDNELSWVRTAYEYLGYCWDAVVRNGESRCWRVAGRCEVSS